MPKGRRSGGGHGKRKKNQQQNPTKSNKNSKKIKLQEPEKTPDLVEEVQRPSMVEWARELYPSAQYGVECFEAMLPQQPSFTPIEPDADSDTIEQLEHEASTLESKLSLAKFILSEPITKYLDALKERQKALKAAKIELESVTEKNAAIAYWTQRKITVLERKFGRSNDPNVAAVKNPQMRQWEEELNSTIGVSNMLRSGEYSYAEYIELYKTSIPPPNKNVNLHEKLLHEIKRSGGNGTYHGCMTLVN